jgi:hypothetical protein
MRTASLMLALLVAAAMAGCLGGSDDEDQPPEDGQASDGTTTTPPGGGSATSGPRGSQQQGSVDAYLEVSASNGTAPLNVTLTFGVNSTAPPQGAGQGGNGTGAGNGTGQAGNGTGQASNGTAQGNASRGTTPPGQSARGSDNLTWTLEVHFTASSGDSASNATGNSTGNQTNSTGNQTGNATGNRTGNQTGTGTQTGTQTGNATGNQTTGPQTGAPAGNGTSDGNATANRTLLASWNGTDDELPGNRTVWLNETGSYEVTFTVYSGNETAAMRTQSVAVTELPPGSPLGNETTTFEGSFLASPLVVCVASNDHDWMLNATFENRSASVSHVNITADGSGLNDIELFLLDSNGTELASGSEIHAEGPFEAGTYTVRVESCVAANARYTVAAVANYAVPDA